MVDNRDRTTEYKIAFSLKMCQYVVALFNQSQNR